MISGKENAPLGALLSDKALFRSLTITFEIQAHRTGRDLQILGNIAVAVAHSFQLYHLGKQVMASLTAVAGPTTAFGYPATDTPALGPSMRLHLAKPCGGESAL